MAVLRCLLVSLLILRIIFAQSQAQPATDPNEVAALNKILNYWNLQSKLNMSVDPCTKNASWAPESANPRIACDCSATVCHITHLKIYALDIFGDLPQELFVLKELVDLNLDQNVLSGTIPAEISQLTKMQYLGLGTNNFSGLVPAELGNLTQLVSLSFGSNNFHGPLPRELGKLTSLTQLYIDSSGVSGPIPQELSNLKSLSTWWASDNRFTGKLPEFIGELTSLTVLRLEGTSLEGPIPSSFGNLTNLQDLRIGDLSNEDSSLDFLEKLTNLSILSLRNCRLTGQLPEKLGTFSKLLTLDLSFNKLTDQIPNSFQGLVSMKYLYLGSNNLTGELPPNLISSELLALDVSFNSISGSLPQNGLGVSINVVGTSINDNALDRRVSSKLDCLKANTECTDLISSGSFSIKCGGTGQVSAAGTKFDDDSETLGAASLYTSSNNQWAVSSSGAYISNPNGGREYTVQTDSQITGTLDSELYKTARISPGSLRYYGLGLKNEKYNVEIHFAEIQMEDSSSWKGLGRRLFDIYIQGEKVVEDLNIQEEAGGSRRALVKTFQANVTNTVMDIHFYWAGRGTCCIPFQSTYGPLVSAIHVTPASGMNSSSKSKKKRTEKIVGITLGSTAMVVIICSILYVWRAKQTPAHMRIHTESPTKG